MDVVLRRPRPSGPVKIRLENGVCWYIVSIDAEDNIKPELGTLAQYNEIGDLDS